MIGILIKYEKKTMFTRLPKDTESLKNQLSRIGLDVPLKSINLSNHNDIGYEVQIFAKDKLDYEIASRIILHDNIEQLNDLLTYVYKGNSDEMYDRIYESCAENISELYKEITAPPAIEPNDKLVIKTTMNYNASFYEPAEYIVEKAIAIPHEKFEALTNITHKSYDFIAQNKADMYYDEDNNCHCLLVYDKGSGDGLLINSEGNSYAKYSAFIPNAKAMLEQHELELSGLKAVKAPITESEKRLLSVISAAADRIATFAHLGNRDFTVEDVLKELLYDFDDIKELIRDSVVEILRTKPDITAVEVSNLDVPLQPEITVTTKETQEQTADEELSGLSL